ncbi:MAG: hypothetical protein ABIF10_02775 [Candidatus Woesearchaeota archaeon]
MKELSDLVELQPKEKPEGWRYRSRYSFADFTLGITVRLYLAYADDGCVRIREGSVVNPCMYKNTFFGNIPDLVLKVSRSGFLVREGARNIAVRESRGYLFWGIADIHEQKRRRSSFDYESISRVDVLKLTKSAKRQE